MCAVKAFTFACDSRRHPYERINFVCGMPEPVLGIHNLKCGLFLLNVMGDNLLNATNDHIKRSHDCCLIHIEETELVDDHNLIVASSPSDYVQQMLS